METRKPETIPADLEEVRQQFESWRNTHAHRSRIPEILWASAVKFMSDIDNEEHLELQRANI